MKNYQDLKNWPLVSVILPTYNRAEYIRKAIESVLTQTYKNLELVIVDDGSIDNTSDIIYGLAKKDKRVKVVQNKTNIGLVKSLNKGITRSKGKYIARIDDDDIWCDKQKLEKQIEFLENNPDYLLVGGGVIRINEKGKEIVRLLLPERNKNIRKAILQNNCFAHSAVVFKKESWQNAGGYDETLNFSEDWDLWMKLGKLGKYYNFQEYFLIYLKAGQNKMSEENSVIRSNAKVNIKLRKRYKKDFPGFRKAYFFGWFDYFYSFLPLRKYLHPLFSRFRRFVFGPPAYKNIIKK